MVDTIRTRAALLTLLADNTSGDISPQDIRDFLVSVNGVYGGISLVGGAAAQSLSTTPAKLSGFTANMVAEGTTPDHTIDSVTVGTAGVYAIWFSVSGEGVTGNTYSFEVRVGGVAQSVRCGLTGVTAATTSAGLSTMLTLAASDIVTIYGESTAGGGANFTPSNMRLMVHRVA